ncbi:MAG: hypothetical protein P8Y66_10885 [Nitrospirota bacterium]|jgi:hypothetical protein
MKGLLDALFGSGPQTVFFWMLVLALAYCAFLAWAGSRRKHSRKTDVERLYEAARRENLSEYEIFVGTGKKWNIPEARAREDFKHYLFHGEIPFYVRDYLRDATGGK